MVLRDISSLKYILVLFATTFISLTLTSFSKTSLLLDAFISNFFMLTPGLNVNKFLPPFISISFSDLKHIVYSFVF